MLWQGGGAVQVGVAADSGLVGLWWRWGEPLHAARRIARSRVFDQDWYCAHLAAPLPRWMPALWHYVRSGGTADPNPLFDTGYYLAQRPEVRRRGVNPLLHYLEAGPEGGSDPHPYFSNWWYFRRHPAARAGRRSALEHYVQEGAARGFSPAPLPHAPRYRLSPAQDLSKGPAPATLPAGDKRVCIFSHFDGRGRILGDVQTYLHALCRSGFTVHLVSTAPHLEPADQRQVEGFGVVVHRRENRGRDFGSWQWALGHVVSPAELDWLLLANDSVFGPLFDLEPILRAQCGSAADFFGITDSYEHAWHLQSYFICLRGEVVRSAAFREVFAQDFANETKRAIIDNGEIFLSQALAEAGFRPSVVCPYPQLDALRPLGTVNPTHYHWDLLISRLGCPFLKKELVRDNPERIPGVADYRSLLARHTAYDVALIETALGR
jgi:rhamnosyltransferase